MSEEKEVKLEEKKMDPTLLAMLSDPFKEEKKEEEIKEEIKEVKVDENGLPLVAKDGDPGPGHERFKEIYKANENAKRENQQFREELESLKKKNLELSETVGDIKDTHLSENRPDPVENPKEFAEWMYKTVENDLKKSAREREDKEVETKPKINETERSKEVDMNAQAAIQRGIHSDYSEVVSITDSDMKTDPILRAQILASEDPPRAAYEHGLARIERVKNSQDSRLKGAYLESSSHSVTEKKDGKPNKEQADMIKKLGLDPKEYMKHDKIINEKRGN